ncbi:hypothetical protein [Gilvimarinus sp. 1_MG-2023]|uniref:hypothetical protein n=1 Tax=Gilvimarinus sp. 1_MG-2023 TaxID=3062638 RepID=UPI0026E18D7C|nr:hypothetical protein [Gilvimarinus sp. 1_MG-2023]
MEDINSMVQFWLTAAGAIFTTAKIFELFFSWLKNSDNKIKDIDIISRISAILLFAAGVICIGAWGLSGFAICLFFSSWVIYTILFLVYKEPLTRESVSSFVISTTATAMLALLYIILKILNLISMTAPG